MHGVTRVDFVGCPTKFLKKADKTGHTAEETLLREMQRRCPILKLEKVVYSSGWKVRLS